MRYRYDPDNPLCNERGMVTIDDYYAYQSFKNTAEDKRMFIGNEPVVLRFISDTMEPTKHPCNGKVYTSKHRFRNETRARGCIEVGNNSEGFKAKKYIQPTSRKERRESIKRSIKQIENKELPERDLALIEKHSKQVDFINRNRQRKA